MNIEELIKLHRCAIENREKLSKSNFCGCFYCKRIYNPNEIKQWTDDDNTAICPHCGVDSVVAEPTEEDLEMLNKYYFNRKEK